MITDEIYLRVFHIPSIINCGKMLIVFVVFRLHVCIDLFESRGSLSSTVETMREGNRIITKAASVVRVLQDRDFVTAAYVTKVCHHYILCVNSMQSRTRECNIFTKFFNFKYKYMLLLHDKSLMCMSFVHDSSSHQMCNCEVHILREM